MTDSLAGAGVAAGAGAGARVGGGAAGTAGGGSSTTGGAGSSAGAPTSVDSASGDEVVPRDGSGGETADIEGSRVVVSGAGASLAGRPIVRSPATRATNAIVIPIPRGSLSEPGTLARTVRGFASGSAAIVGGWGTSWNAAVSAWDGALRGGGEPGPLGLRDPIGVGLV